MVAAEWDAILADQQATRQLGVRLGQLLCVNSILLLNGDLGSGKTTLVQGIGEGLGIGEPIVSPTFTLICEYPEGRIPLYHFDLYRLQPQEVEELYLEAYWEGTDYPLGIVAIEWAERLPHLPSEYWQIFLKAVDGGRRVQIQAMGPGHQQQLQRMVAGFQPV